MKKQVYINPATQVFELTGMQVMNGVSDPGGSGYGGGTSGTGIGSGD